MPQATFNYAGNLYIVDTDSNPPALWRAGAQGPVQVPESDPAFNNTELRQAAVNAIYSQQPRTAADVAGNNLGPVPPLSNPLAGTATTPQLSGGANQPAPAPRTAAQVAASGGGVGSGATSLPTSVPQFPNPLAGTATTPQLTPAPGSNQPPVVARTAGQVAGNPGLSWPNIPLPSLSNPLAGTATQPQLHPNVDANQPPSQARTAAQVAASGNGVGSQSTSTTAPAAAPPAAPAAGGTGTRWVPDPSLAVGGYFVDAQGQPLPGPVMQKDNKTPSVWDGTKYVPGATTAVTAAPAAADSTAAAPAAAAGSNLSAVQQRILSGMGRGGWTVMGDTDEMKSQTVTDESGISSTKLGPTGNKVWAITGPSGKNEVVTVRPSATTPGDYDVVTPPPNLPAPQAPTGNENTGWWAQDPADNQWKMVIAPHTPNADEEIKKAVDRQTAEAMRNEKQRNADAGRGYQTDSDYASMISQAKKDNISAATLAENIRQFDVTQGQKNKEFDITQAAADKRDAANIGKTTAETTQLGATTAQTQLTTQQQAAKFPGELAQQQATLAGTLENNLTTAQSRAIAAAPQLKGTPGGANALTTVNPLTGRVDQSQMDLAYQPKTQAEIAARVGQIQSLMNAKSAEVQGKVGQTIGGKVYSADDALKEFNAWHTQQVEPQTAALAAAQDEAAFQRGKDQAAMRTSAFTAANAASTSAINAFNAMKGANPVENQAAFNSAAADLAKGKMPANLAEATTWHGPNPIALSQAATMNALKYIDPQAAAATGTPPPNYAGMDISALTRNPYIAPGMGGVNRDPGFNMTQQQVAQLQNTTGQPGGAQVGGPAPTPAPVQGQQTPAWWDSVMNRTRQDQLDQQRQAQVNVAGPPSMPGMYDASMQNRVAQPAGMPATGGVAGQMPDWLVNGTPPPPDASGAPQNPQNWWQRLMGQYAPSTASGM